jgi:hypothetical protein
MRNKDIHHHNCDDCKCCIIYCMPFISLFVACEYLLKCIFCCPCYIECENNNENETYVNNENITPEPDNNNNEKKKINNSTNYDPFNPHNLNCGEQICY